MKNKLLILSGLLLSTVLNPTIPVDFDLKKIKEYEKAESSRRAPLEKKAREIEEWKREEDSQREQRRSEYMSTLEKWTSESQKRPVSPDLNSQDLKRSRVLSYAEKKAEEIPESMINASQKLDDFRPEVLREKVSRFSLYLEGKPLIFQFIPSCYPHQRKYIGPKEFVIEQNDCVQDVLNKCKKIPNKKPFLVFSNYFEEAVAVDGRMPFNHRFFNDKDKDFFITYVDTQ